MKTRRLTTQIGEAADILRRGGLVAVPTETVYGLAGNGLDPEVIREIYEVKGRPAVKPISLMVPGAAPRNPARRGTDGGTALSETGTDPGAAEKTGFPAGGPIGKSLGQTEPCDG